MATPLGNRMSERRNALNATGEPVGADEASMTLEELSGLMTGSGKRDASTLSDIELGDIETPPTEVIGALESALNLPDGELEALVDREEASAGKQAHFTLDCEMSPTVLRAHGASSALTTAERLDMLTRSRAGEHFTLAMDITSFLQIPGVSNRNHIRFRTGSLMAMGRSGKSSVFLMNHDQHDVLARGGTITASKMLSIDGSHKLIQTAELVKPWAVQGALDGTIDRFSIGWDDSDVLCLACGASIAGCWHYPGQSIEVNGLATVVEWEYQNPVLVETSAVNVPAVLNTGVDGMRALGTSIRGALGLSTQPPTRKPEQMAVTTEAEKLAITKAETDRILGIQTAGAALLKKNPDASKLIAAAAADPTITVDAFKLSAFDSFAAANPSPIKDSGRPVITPGADQRDKINKETLDWLCHKAGIHTRLKAQSAAKQGDYRNDGGGQFRGMSLMEMAKHHLTIAGVNTSHLTTEQIIRQALGGGYQHTADFPVGLEGVINQEMTSRFELLTTTWQLLGRTGTANDFKPTTVYRRGTFGRLDKYIEGQEIENKKVPDLVREQIGLATVANIIEIGRETMINDNLGFLTDQAGDLGDAAALSVELDFYAIILENAGLGPIMADGEALLSAAHKNVYPSSALSIDAIDADAALMAEQTDITGQTIALEPSLLWLPRTLRGVARQINESTNDFTAGVQVPVPNKVANQFTNIIATTRLPKSPPRRYYIAGLERSPLRIQFLNGQSTPRLDREEGFRRLGTSWSIVYDYKWGVVSHEGIATNQGT